MEERNIISIIREICKYHAKADSWDDIIIVDTKRNIKRMVSDIEITFKDSTLSSELFKKAQNPVLKNCKSFRIYGRTTILIEKEELVSILVKERPW